MATKTLTVVRPGTYGTRMLKAGETLDVSGPDARLYTKLGWMKDGAAPAKAAAQKTAPKPKAAPRKRTRKATAKKSAAKK